MTNKENLNPDQKSCLVALQQLTIELLKNLQQVSPESIKESHLFFNEAFINHADDDLFEDKEYRLKWKQSLGSIALLSSFFNKHSETQLKQALNDSIILLESA